MINIVERKKKKKIGAKLFL